MYHVARGIGGKRNIMKTKFPSIKHCSLICDEIWNAVHKIVDNSHFLGSSVLPHLMMTSVFRMEGTVKNTDSKLATMFIGDKTAAYHFAFLVYSGKPEVKKVGIIARSKIFSYSLTTPVDIIFMQTERMFKEKLKNMGFTVMPRVNFMLDLFPNFDEIIKKMSRRRRRNIAKMGKYGYSYEIFKTREALDFFYFKMYVPYAQTRYREAAYVEPLLKLRKLFSKGGILFVKRGGKYIAGIMYYITGKVVNAYCLGIYKGEEQYLRENALQALLYFLVLWARSQGFSELNYGPNRPFLAEGNFIYKKEWGMRIREQCPHQSIYALRLCNFKKATRDFLLNNPFIFSGGNTLNGLVVIDKTLSSTDLTRICRSFSVPGIQRLFVLTYSREKPAKNEKVFQNLPASLLLNVDQIVKEGFNLQVHCFSFDNIQSARA